MMNVRWMHINPTSFALTLALKQAAPVHSWKKEIPDYWQDVLRTIDHHALTQSSLPQHLLLTSDLPVKSIAQKAGYLCPFHFAKIFHHYFGQSPSRRRTQNLPFSRP